MKIEKSQYSKLWFWGIIVVGFLLPLAGEVVADVTFKSTSIFEAIKRALPDFSAFPVPVVLLIWLLMLLWNDVPFIVLAVVANYQSCKSIEQDSQIYIKIIASTIVATIMGFSTSIFIQFDAWSAAFRGEPGASTTPLIYIFLPFPVSIIMVVGYGLGWFIGMLIIWGRNKKSAEGKLNNAL